MSRTSSIRASIAFGAATICLLSAFQNASAVTTQARSFSLNATGACQSALPVFDVQVRKRPMAVQNEGTAPAWISCSIGTNSSYGGITKVSLYAENNTGTAQQLACTLVHGFTAGSGPPTYHPKTLLLPANTTDSQIVWDKTDNGGSSFDDVAISFSCLLPVGVGVSNLMTNYLENVGN